MIWKEWNSEYVAEMPYLTPLKVSLVSILVMSLFYQC